jgi:putative ABC transport system permease protein
MRKLVLRGLRARTRRLVGTFVAIFLGVAFLAGTLVLNDTLDANFDTLFSQANAGTDVVVRNATDVTTDPSQSRGLIDARVLDAVREVDGVADAVPSIEGTAVIVGADGNVLGGNGPPTIGGNWIDDPNLSAYELAEGRAPRADDEVVINRGAAKDGNLHLGDRIQVRVPQPVEMTLVGISTFEGKDGFGPVTFAAFSLDAAQRYLAGGTAQVTTIQVHAAAGVDGEQLAQRVERVLPGGVEAVPGSTVTNEDLDQINSTFLGFFETFLLVFSLIALLVATFTIYNSFSIVVAQRTRESALLRALGASRSQLVRSVVAEAAVVGAVASAAGVAGGIGIATLLKALFKATGFDALPTGGLVVRLVPVIASFLVGVVVATVAGVAPAVRAGRVAPLAALRDLAVESTGVSRRRLVVGLAATVIGVALVLTGAITGNLPLVGLGALATVAGFVVAGPLVARPASAVLGAPVAASRGVPGSLARQNAMRSPRRTAGTAGALMVGVGVVTLFTVFASSIKASIQDAVGASFTGDLVVTTGTFGGGGLSPSLAGDLAVSPDVAAVVGLGRGSVRLGGSARSLTVVDPASLQQVTELDVTSGRLDDLAAGTVAVSDSLAKAHGWRVGSELPITFADGSKSSVQVAALYDRPEIVGNVLMSRDAWAPHAVQDIDGNVLIALRDGVSVDDGERAIAPIVAGYGNPDVDTRQEFIDANAAGIDMALGIVYVLLALAIFIAVMGIANTLSLSIHERTRELGLLRAVGQDRRGIRSMVRWESVIVAVFGTVGGVALGTFLGWGLMRGIAAGESAMLARFALPIGPLVVVLVVGALAGVIAAVRPARRAAKLDVLAALAM